MLQRRVLQVEVHTFHQQVGGDQHLSAFGILEDGAVIAHALQRLAVFCLYVVGEVVNKPELTQFCNFQ